MTTKTTAITNSNVLDKIGEITSRALSSYESAPTEALAEEWLVEELLEIRDLLNATWPPNSSRQKHSNDRRTQKSE